MAHKYMPLAPNESASSLQATETHKRQKILRNCFFLVLGISLTANFGLILTGWRQQDHNLQTTTAAPPISPSSSWERIWGDLPTLSTTWESWSEYSKPGEDATERWNELSKPGLGLINIPHPRSANLPKSFSLPDRDDSAEVYMTSGAHQLHCLTMLRVFVSNSYESSHNEASPLERRKMNSHAPEIHLFHCLDYIRQAIMCTGDTTLEPVDYVRGENGLTDGFEIDATATPRVCKDWNVMRRVMDEFAIPIKDDLRKH